MYLQRSYMVMDMEDFHWSVTWLTSIKGREKYLGLLTKDSSKKSTCKPGRNCTLISAINSSAGLAIRNKEGIIWKGNGYDTQISCTSEQIQHPTEREHCFHLTIISLAKLRFPVQEVHNEIPLCLWGDTVPQDPSYPELLWLLSTFLIIIFSKSSLTTF